MTGREIEVYTNGTKAEMSDQPTIKDGIVMLPVKETFEKLGAKVNWDEATQAVTIEKDGNYIYMLRDNKGIMINGEIYDLGYPMTMIEDVAYGIADSDRNVNNTERNMERRTVSN